MKKNIMFNIGWSDIKHALHENMRRSPGAVITGLDCGNVENTS